MYVKKICSTPPPKKNCPWYIFIEGGGGYPTSHNGLWFTLFLDAQKDERLHFRKHVSTT